MVQDVILDDPLNSFTPEHEKQKAQVTKAGSDPHYSVFLVDQIYT